LTAPGAFSDRAAYYFGELHALHPFREANGFYIAWENVTPADMLAAAIQSFHGDTAKLAALIRKEPHRLGIRPRRPAWYAGEVFDRSTRRRGG
jgi:hypothetical protein